MRLKFMISEKTNLFSWSRVSSECLIICSCRKLAQQMAKMSEEQRAELVRARQAVALQVRLNFVPHFCLRDLPVRKLVLPLHQEL